MIRIPKAAKRGARIDWPRLCRYGVDSAALYRAYLSVSALLDNAARDGHPITREIGAPLLRPDGEPKRRQGGGIIRSATEFVPNPSAKYVHVLTDGDLARLIGFDGDVRDHRYKARKAIERLDGDNVIELVRVPGGVKLYGPRKG